MSALSNVRQARITLKSRNSTDLTNNENLKDLFQEAQDLIACMNRDKLKAIAEVEEQYRERLETIDRELAIFVTLSGE